MVQRLSHVARDFVIITAISLQFIDPSKLKIMATGGQVTADEGYLSH